MSYMVEIVNFYGRVRPACPHVRCSGAGVADAFAVNSPRSRSGPCTDPRRVFDFTTKANWETFDRLGLLSEHINSLCVYPSQRTYGPFGAQSVCLLAAIRQRSALRRGADRAARNYC